MCLAKLGKRFVVEVAVPHTEDNVQTAALPGKVYNKNERASNVEG